MLVSPEAWTTRDTVPGTMQLPGKRRRLSLDCSNESQHKPSRRLFVTDTKSKVTFRVDSGADVSVIPPTQQDRRRKALPASLFAANGTPIKTYGYRLACLNLGLPRELKAIFLIAEVTKPIIGADILYQNNLAIDLRGKRLIDTHSNFSIVGTVRPSAAILPQVFASTQLPNEDEFQRILKAFPELTEPMTYGRPVKHRVVHRIETNGQPG
jgi:hypothetical protein